MVHGGGHHHPNSGGAGGGGEAFFNGGGHYQRGNYQYDRTNNFFFFNSSTRLQNPNTVWWSSLQPQWNATHRHSIGSESTTRSRYNNGDCDCCERFCESCCVLLCACLCCTAWNSASRSTTTTTSVAHQQHQQSREAALSPDKSKRHISSIFCPSLIFSVVAFVVLLSVSAVSRGNDNWSLYAGETKRITKPFLNKNLVVSSNGGSVSVYELTGNCPPLTGTPVVLEDQFSFRLSPDDFQFDYFFLNAGSLIELDVTQAVGSTNIYILKGQRMLRRFQSDQDDDDDDDDEGGLKGNALLTRYVSAGSGLDQLHVSYSVTKNDIYALFYDNASTATGDLTVHYKVTASTYDLRGEEPICRNVVTPCAVVESAPRSCLLVQAVVDSDGSPSANDVVTVSVTGRRAWLTICFISATPVFIQVVLACLCSQRHRNYERIEDDVDPYTLPPAMAPPYKDSSSTIVEPNFATMPSAPVEEVLAIPVFAMDVPITVPIENIIPVPPPSK